MYRAFRLGNGKLGRTGTMYFPPGITCNPEVPCYNICYANHGKCRMQHEKWFESYEFYLDSPQKFFDEIEEDLYLSEVRYFRWFSGGDCPDVRFLENIVRIAKEYFDVNFLCMTKQYDMFNKYFDEHEQPKNLKILFSDIKGFVDGKNPHNFPTTSIRFKDYEPLEHLKNGEFAFQCRGNKDGGCECCRKCWFARNNDVIIIDKH